MEKTGESTRQKIDEWDNGIVKDIVNIMAKRGITYGESGHVLGRVMAAVIRQERRCVIKQES